MYKKTKSDRWTSVKNIEAEIKNIVGLDNDADWLDLFTSPDDGESLELEVGNETYLIVKLDNVGHRKRLLEALKQR
jgi:hypothetical protein